MERISFFILFWKENITINGLNVLNIYYSTDTDKNKLHTTTNTMCYIRGETGGLLKIIGCRVKAW
jgi:hypothetical protein